MFMYIKQYISSIQEKDVSWRELTYTHISEPYFEKN